MSDLAKRLLRKHNPTFVESINGKPFQVPVNPDGADAVAHIESQAERIKALEAGLKPFASLVSKTNPSSSDVRLLTITVPYGDLRRAAALLNEKGK